MASLYLDTHAVAWLFAGELEKFSSRGLEEMEERELRISPIVGLELEFLHEIGRLNYRAEEIVGALHREIGLQRCSLPFVNVAKRAESLSWTRDPFDRTIVAQADYASAPLLTRDRRILQKCDFAFW